MLKIDYKSIISPAKNIWQYMGVVFILSSVTIFLLWNGPWDDPQRVAMALIWNFAIWFTQIFGHSIHFQLWDRVLPWTKTPLLRALATLLSIIVYAAVAFAVVQTIMMLIFFQQFPDSSFWNIITNSGTAVAIAIGFSVVVTLVSFFNAWRKSELEKEKVKTEMMTYKYNALQNQINPHFLFNSFNVLSELVYEDQDLAVRFIRQMSDLYRYVLSTKNEDLVPLKKEIEFIKSFSFLLETRFESRVAIVNELEANSDEYIVPIALQVLVENAVKHNEATSAKPLAITLRRSDDGIQVSNNLKPKPWEPDSTNTGLTYLRERYEYLGKRVYVGRTNDQFKVELPIIKLDD